ncbi:MAG: hypothetical protein GYB68_13840 [Chloroflexi bacterium]|nr:hypothetical protein [Chloroflexota bacterium]
MLPELRLDLTRLCGGNRAARHEHITTSGCYLLATASRRFHAAEVALDTRHPQTGGACLAILTGPSGQMSITVQQMVFCAATDQLDVRFPQPLAR